MFAETTLVSSWKFFVRNGCTFRKFVKSRVNLGGNSAHSYGYILYCASSPPFSCDIAVIYCNFSHPLHYFQVRTPLFANVSNRHRFIYDPKFLSGLTTTGNSKWDRFSVKYTCTTSLQILIYPNNNKSHFTQFNWQQCLARMYASDICVLLINILPT